MVLYNLVKSQSFSESVALACDYHKYFFLYSSFLFQRDDKAKEG